MCLEAPALVYSQNVGKAPQCLNAVGTLSELLLGILASSLCLMLRF